MKREKLVIQGSNKRLYVPCPFIPNATNLARLCKGLLVQKMPLVYSVALQPTHLTKKEKRYIENPFLNAGLIEGFVSSNGTGNKKESDSADLPSMGKSLYLMKIQVAADREIPYSLIDLIGSEISVPPSLGEFDNDKRIARIYQGGYTWFSPKNKSESRIALNNLKYQELNPWVPSIAPEELIA